EPLNIVCDSIYVVGVVQRIERAQLKYVEKLELFTKFKELLFTIEQRTHPYCTIHTRSHTQLPGIFTEGNADADRLANLAVPIPNLREQAQLSHGFFHQSAKALAKQFRLPIADAKWIMQTCPNCQTCPDCQVFTSGPPATVNPCGLRGLQLWQTDVTHVPEFGRQKHIHISIDTYSCAVWATVATGETSRHAQAHFQSAVVALGIPTEVKTGNGLAYTSTSLRTFFQIWGIRHVTGIPHSPTGQTIVERTHRTLKQYLVKQKGG
ncbi:POK11 protein, partial [Steatornis caripensis]|nr:POK11 protein [Steatornis caripensis]